MHKATAWLEGLIVRGLKRRVTKWGTYYHTIASSNPDKAVVLEYLALLADIADPPSKAESRTTGRERYVLTIAPVSRRVEEEEKDMGTAQHEIRGGGSRSREEASVR